MAGRKVWAADDVLTAADVNDYLMDQAVMVFSSTTTRDGAILSPTEGMLVYLTDTNKYQQWDGSAWIDLFTAGIATTAANSNKVSNQTVFIQSTTPTANATNDLWFW